MHPSRIVRTTAALMVGTALSLAVLRFGAPAGAAEQIVEIKGLTFIPEELAVAEGDAVTWVNFDEDHHDIVGGPIDSPEMAKDDTYSFTFEQPFAFEYRCKIHTYMRGRITVGDGSAGTGVEEGPYTPPTEPKEPPPTPPPGGPLGLPVPAGIS